MRAFASTFLVIVLSTELQTLFNLEIQVCNLWKIEHELSCHLSLLSNMMPGGGLPCQRLPMNAAAGIVQQMYCNFT